MLSSFIALNWYAFTFNEFMKECKNFIHIHTMVPDSDLLVMQNAVDQLNESTNVIIHVWCCFTFTIARPLSYLHGGIEML